MTVMEAVCHLSCSAHARAAITEVKPVLLTASGKDSKEAACLWRALPPHRNEARISDTVNHLSSFPFRTILGGKESELQWWELE
jgi:hypothetical protein